MNNIDIVKDAIDATEERLKKIPDFEIYQSVHRQLKYLNDALSDDKADRSSLDKIIVGHYAVHEFEETDPEFSKHLKKCQKIVFDMTS